MTRTATQRAAPRRRATPKPAAAQASAPAAAKRPRWATEAFWRMWAGRLLALWTLLMLLLVGLRVATSDIRPELRAAQDEHTRLIAERDRLSLEVQTLNAPARIRGWAEENGMVRFTDAAGKHRADFGTGVSAPPEPAQPTASDRLHMRLEWRPTDQPTPTTPTATPTEETP